jgi:putative ABC transport system permease protein
MVAALRAHPGVASAAFATGKGYWAWGGGGQLPPLRLQGAEPVPEDAPLEGRPLNRVGVGYFETIGLPVVRGRAFSAEDHRDAPSVAMVNETLAEKYWPGEDAVGKRFWITPTRLVEVVGVASGARDQDYLSQLPVVYVPYAQAAALQSVGLFVRPRDGSVPVAELVRDVITRVEPRTSVRRIGLWDEELERTLRVPRFSAVAFSLFAFMAGAIAASGVFGVLAFMVSQRTHEIGVRMALGGRPRDVIALVVRQVGGLAVLGLAVGVWGAFASGELLSSWLYEIEPTDPESLAGAVAILLTAATAAAWLPVRRALSIDPVRSLSHE